MLNLTYITTFVLLLLITVQDFRFRAISWIWIPLLFISVLAKALFVSDSLVVLDSIMQNILFIVLQMGVLILYFSIRKKKFESVINSYIGWGDILFFVAIAPALCFGNFLLFIVFSILFILISYSILSIFKINTDKQIPLAGIQSVFLLFWFTGEWIFDPFLSYTYLPLYFVS
jgi:hypothetical protein